MQMTVNLVNRISNRYRILDNSHQIVCVVVGIECRTMIDTITILCRTVCTNHSQQIESRLKTADCLIHVKTCIISLESIDLLWLLALGGNLTCSRSSLLAFPPVETIAKGGISNQTSHIRTSHITTIDSLLQPIGHTSGLLGNK